MPAYLTICLGFYVVGILIDCVTTYIGVKYYNAVEVDKLFKHIAQLPLPVFISTLTIAKLLTIPIIIWSCITIPFTAPIFAIVCIAYLRIPISNLLQLAQNKSMCKNL